MKERLNGPGFAAWLEETLPETVAQHRSIKGSSITRALHRWRDGEQVTVEAADRWLTHFSIPLSWVPDELWEDTRERFRPHPYGGHHNAFPLGVRQRAVDRVLDGERPVDVARDLGCTTRTLRGWRQSLARVPA